MKNDGLVALIALQDGLMSRRQAVDSGLDDADLRRLLRRRERAGVYPGVFVNHTGPLTWHQRAWAAVLHAYPAALCAQSALRAATVPVIAITTTRRRSTSRPKGIGTAVHRTASCSNG